MKIFELLRSPLVKGIGILLILYFALFSNKENPNSLGNRLSTENIKKDLSEAQEKSKFIIANVRVAQEVSKERAAQQQAATQISIEDLEIGVGEDKVSCGDQVEISQGIYKKDGGQIDLINSKKFIIGTKVEEFIEKNIIDLKQGAIRNINIPYGFQSSDKKIAELLKFNATDIKYQITILDIKKNVSPTTSCS